MQDIAGWEAALKQAAGTHKTLVRAVNQYKQLLADSKNRLQQERASHRELAAQCISCTGRMHLPVAPARKCTHAGKLQPSQSQPTHHEFHAPAGESIHQMSLMTAQIQEKTAALIAQEETMHSLRYSEERLAKLAGDQRQHIQDLQAKLMDSLCEVRFSNLQL